MTVIPNKFHSFTSTAYQQDLYKKNSQFAHENNILKAKLSRYEKENIELKKQVLDLRSQNKSISQKLNEFLNNSGSLKSTLDIIAGNIQALMAFSVAGFHDAAEQEAPVFAMSEQEKQRKRRESMDLLTSKFREKAGDLSTIIECSFHPTRPSTCRLRLSSIGGVSDNNPSIEMNIDLNPSPRVPTIETPQSSAENGRNTSEILDSTDTPSPPPSVLNENFKEILFKHKTPDMNEHSSSESDEFVTEDDDQQDLKAKPKKPTKLKKTNSLKPPKPKLRRSIEPSQTPLCFSSPFQDILDCNSAAAQGPEITDVAKTTTPAEIITPTAPVFVHSPIGSKSKLVEKKEKKTKERERKVPKKESKKSEVVKDSSVTDEAVAPTSKVVVETPQPPDLSTSKKQKKEKLSKSATHNAVLTKKSSTDIPTTVKSSAEESVRKYGAPEVTETIKASSLVENVASTNNSEVKETIQEASSQNSAVSTSEALEASAVVDTKKDKMKENPVKDKKEKTTRAPSQSTSGEKNIQKLYKEIITKTKAKETSKVAKVKTVVTDQVNRPSRSREGDSAEVEAPSKPKDVVPLSHTEKLPEVLKTLEEPLNVKEPLIDYTPLQETPVTPESKPVEKKADKAKATRARKVPLPEVNEDIPAKRALRPRKVAVVYVDESPAK